MPIDSSIYLKQRGTQADLGAAFERGMRMGEMYKQGKEKRDTKAAYAQGMDTNEDGSQSINEGRTLSALMKSNPEEGLRFKEKMTERSAAEMKAKRDKMLFDNDMSTRGAFAVLENPTEETYQQVIKDLADKGVDVSKAPPNLDLNWVKSAYLRGMSVQDQVANKFKERELRIKEQELDLKKKGASGGGMAKPPPNYRWTADGKALEPIPGGPADIKAGAAAEKAAKGEAKQKLDASLVVQDIGRSLDIIDKHSSAAGTGDFGLLSYVPGTPTQKLDNLLESVKSNIGFAKLQAMREASPTGGALGSVSDKENAMLQATAGTLRSNMPEDQLKDNLKRLYNQYNDIVHGPGKGPPRHQLSFDEQGNPVEQRLVNSSQPQTKVVDGVTYKKVQGGWEEVPMPASR